MDNDLKLLAVGFVSGTNGAIASVYVGQPLDTVKVKMQTFPHLYKNAYQCIMKTYKKDGIRRGLYLGTLPALTANIAENAILFAALDPTKKVIANFCGVPSLEDLSVFQCAISGSLAAFWSSLTLCPTELIKCRLQAMREQVEMGQIKNVNLREITPWSICRNIWREDGFKGFFRGLTPTFGREMPGYFFFFGGYELSRSIFLRYSTEQDRILGPMATAFCGGIGGVSCWTAIFPFDVLKSRMHIAGGQSVNMGQMFKDILKNEGFKALYKGLGPTLTRTFPATGALFVAYEWTRRFLM